MSDDEKVGYGRPPKSGRVRNGEVRNPWGRAGKKGKAKDPQDNSTAAIIKRLDAEIIEFQGKSMTRREWELLGLSNRAIKGDPKASAMLEKLRPKETPAQTNSGVLFLPSAVPLHEWEASAAIQQAPFRENPDGYSRAEVKPKKEEDKKED